MTHGWRVRDHLLMALLVALAGAAYALGDWRRERRSMSLLPGAAVAIAALAPIGFLALAFPEGGVEPFVFSAFWPIPLLALGALLATRREQVTLRAGIVLDALATDASYASPSAVGSIAGRLGTWLAAPLEAGASVARK